jgi:hypothetical protein
MPLRGTQRQHEDPARLAARDQREGMQLTRGRGGRRRLRRQQPIGGDVAAARQGELQLGLDHRFEGGAVPAEVTLPARHARMASRPRRAILAREHHHGMVGEERHHEARGAAQDGVHVERAADGVGGLGEEARAPLGVLGRGARGLLARERYALVGALPQLVVQAMELHQGLHLAAQDVRHDRREDVVDGAERVATGRVHLVGEGGDEDDRRVRRLAPRPDELRRLEAVHARHVHVEQDHRALVVEQPAQGLLAGGSGDDVLVQLLEDGPEHHALVEPVVDDEDVRAVERRRGGRRVGARCDDRGLDVQAEFLTSATMPSGP